MTENGPVLKGSVLVVAHPDDEVLWFCSQLPDVERVIMVFRDYDGEPGLGERRARAMIELPYQAISLNVPEAGTLKGVDWDKPEITPFGLRLNAEEATRESIDAYAGNYSLIHALLADQLSESDTVFTHNPWGEYGHPDHVQVYRAVESLCAKLGFSLWVSSHIADRSRHLARIYSIPPDDETLRCPIDRDFAANVSQIYKKHGCWTWDHDWEWNASESFLRPPNLKETGQTCG